MAPTPSPRPPTTTARCQRVSYTVTDGSGTDVTSTLNISVTPVDDSFTDASETVTTSEDTASHRQRARRHEQRRRPGQRGQLHRWRHPLTPAGETATIANVGTLVHRRRTAPTPSPRPPTTTARCQRVSYTVTDGSGTDVTSTLNISVTPVDDSFTDASETVTTAKTPPSPAASSTARAASMARSAWSTSPSAEPSTYAAGSTATIANVGTLVHRGRWRLHLHPGRQLQRHRASGQLHRHRRLRHRRHLDPEHQRHPGRRQLHRCQRNACPPEDTAVTGSVLDGTSSVDGPSACSTSPSVAPLTPAGSTATIANVGTLVHRRRWRLHLHPGRQLQRHGANGQLHRHRRLRHQRHLDPEHQRHPGRRQLHRCQRNRDHPRRHRRHRQRARPAPAASTARSAWSTSPSVATTYAAGSTATIANVGTLVIAANGAYTFTPAANYNGTVPTRQLHRHRRLRHQRHLDPEHQRHPGQRQLHRRQRNA